MAKRRKHRKVHHRRIRKVRRTRRTRSAGRLRAPVVKQSGSKRYFLTKFAFTNKPAAMQTGRALKKNKRIKGVKIVGKTMKGKKYYLIYIAV